MGKARPIIQWANSTSVSPMAPTRNTIWTEIIDWINSTLSCKVVKTTVLYPPGGRKLSIVENVPMKRFEDERWLTFSIELNESTTKKRRISNQTFIEYPLPFSLFNCVHYKWGISFVRWLRVNNLNQENYYSLQSHKIVNYTFHSCSKCTSYWRIYTNW